ncbi:uncharacterized protein PHALS_00106 [Plasmopara halstedii]|uniref:Uncharacterized protein n=1 Tax=Plasmopara halstedii TaxID=4781 RepID=A0A0P1A5E1_PLAHL|nr:uncharacterized protein PHALS_00106 [Plasmopara halstedii]CEG35773.1 hypothetical protein PHALS_00106 [Plasmopara halstedii]|eukprot:XP_024572142.1 hypothetical protein PHALS_00106 [Plasmopara halstedii]
MRIKACLQQVENLLVLIRKCPSTQPKPTRDLAQGYILRKKTSFFLVMEAYRKTFVWSFVPAYILKEKMSRVRQCDIKLVLYYCLFYIFGAFTQSILRSSHRTSV